MYLRKHRGGNETRTLGTRLRRLRAYEQRNRGNCVVFCLSQGRARTQTHPQFFCVRGCECPIRFHLVLVRIFFLLSSFSNAGGYQFFMPLSYGDDRLEAGQFGLFTRYPCVFGQPDFWSVSTCSRSVEVDTKAALCYDTHCTRLCNAVVCLADEGRTGSASNLRGRTTQWGT